MRRDAGLLTSAMTIAIGVGVSLMSAQTIDRTKPPETPPLPAYHLPPVFETKLPNGLAVVLLDDPRFPMVTVRLAFDGGSRAEAAGLRGLSEAAAALLTEGTRRRTSRQISEEAVAMGGSVGAQSSPDALMISGSALSEHAVELLDLVADVARHATFPSDEVELYKRNRRQELLRQSSQSEFLATEKLYEVLFGANPYGQINPTAESIGKVDVAALVKFRNAYLAPNNAVLIVLGRLPRRGELLKLLQQKFGDWERRDVPPLPSTPSPPAGKTIKLVDRPGSVQADVHIGRVTVTRASPDYFPLMMASGILGGGASSRLFAEIRERQGFAYSVYSHVLPMKEAGTFSAVMQVRNEVLGPAIGSMLGALNGMANQPVSPSELSDMKNYMAGIFVLRLLTQDGLASQLAVTKSVGLPLDYLETYTTKIRSVEPDQMQAAARKFIAPDQSAIVVVGDAKQIGPALEKFGTVEVIRSH